MNWGISRTGAGYSIQCHQPGYRRAAAFADQPVFAEVIRGIETVTDAAGYQTMLAHYGYQAEKEEDRPVSCCLTILTA